MKRPAGITALSAFFAFGTVMSGLACLALLMPASFLASVWRLNPSAHAALVTLGPAAIVLMAMVSLACGLAAAGLWLGKWWGHRVALAVLAINLLGDTANAVLRGDLRTLIGLPIGGAMIAYLLTAKVRQIFARE